MKLVVFSDLHLDAQFAWASSNGEAARRRRTALRETLLRIAELAREVGADALCAAATCTSTIGTPRARSNSSAQHLSVSIQFLSSWCPVTHDWYGPTSIYHRAEWSENVTVFREAKLQPVELDDGLTLWGAAHRAPAHTDGFLDRFRVDRGGVNLALSMVRNDPGSPSRATKGAARAVQPGADRRRGPPACLSGPLPPTARRRALHLPRNPDPLTFGEDGQRGAVITTIRQDGTIVRERRTVAVTDCHDLLLDVSGCHSQQDVRERLVEQTSGLHGVARVTLQGELDPRVDLRLRDLEDCATTLEALTLRAGRLHAGYDLATIAAEPTVRGAFVRDVQSAVMPDERRRRILATGLRALDGRDDLEVL